MRRRADDAPAQRPIGHGSSASRAVEAAPAEAEAPPPEGSVEELVRLMGARPVPTSLRARLKRRLLRHELDRQERINQVVLYALQEVKSGRELKMLRTGLYELGERLSIVSSELRDDRGRDGG